MVCIDLAVLAVLCLRGTAWFPYRRYAGNPTLNQLNKVSPPLGHWNPETLEPRVDATGHWNLGTSEPQLHREEKGHRPDNREWAPTRGTVFFFRYPLGSHWRSLRCAFRCRAAHGGYDVGGARWVQLLIDNPCARDFNFQVFKWRGQSLDWCRASCCCFTFQLSWSICADTMAGCLPKSQVMFLLTQCMP